LREPERREHDFELEQAKPFQRREQREQRQQRERQQHRARDDQHTNGAGGLLFHIKNQRDAGDRDHVEQQADQLDRERVGRPEADHQQRHEQREHQQVRCRSPHRIDLASGIRQASARL
jgi:hypothetical protein